jgi:hypothetical protein
MLCLACFTPAETDLESKIFFGVAVVGFGVVGSDARRRPDELCDQRSRDLIHRNFLCKCDDKFSEPRCPLLEVVLASSADNSPFRHSGFVIDSDFWFRHSDFYCTMPLVNRMNAVSKFTSSSFNNVNLNPPCTSRCGINV